MTTIESPLIAELARRIVRAEPAAVFLGSVPGNMATELGHSYHRSWDDSPHDGGYSVHYWGDQHPRSGTANMACAIDIGFGSRDDLMRKYTGRMRTWAEGGKKVPLAYQVREFAGTLDSREVFAMDTTGTPRQTWGWDDSHLHHIHISVNRHAINNAAILTIARLFAP